MTIYMKWRLADDPCGLPMATVDGEIRLDMVYVGLTWFNQQPWMMMEIVY